MKKIHYSLLGLLVIFFITSSTMKPQESQESQRVYEKIAFVELDFKSDSVMFMPYSKAWQTYWISPSDLLVDNSDLMNSNKYISAFENRNDNLWTVLHPLIITGDIQPYSPYALESYGKGVSDDGELRHPVLGNQENSSFLTSEKIRTELSYLLGKYGPESDIPLTDEYGDPITIADEHGSIMFVYPPRNYNWYEDVDIVKYKLRISVQYNKKGKEKKRVIKSICPVTYSISEAKQIEGEKEIIWLDFEELRPHLEEPYYFDGSGKPVTYLDHILQKVKNADLARKE